MTAKFTGCRGLAGLVAVALALLSGCTKVKLINHSKNLKLEPGVASVSPAVGTLDGGTLITITGKGFASGASVKLGDESCLDVVFVSSTTLTCTTPPHALGPVTVTVLDPDGESAELASAYAYISNLAPVAGQAIVSGGGISHGTGMVVQATIGQVTGPIIQTSATVQSLSGIQGALYQP